MPLLTLIPPLIAIFILLSATENEIWKGVLVGVLAAMCVVLFRNEYKVLLYWRNVDGWPNNAIRLTVELFYIWIFFQVAAFPLVGGCIEAIRKQYASLGIHSLLATFVYYFGLVLGFIWIVCNEYWE